MTTTILEPIPAGAYKLDPIHSSFGFAVKHNGISTLPRPVRAGRRRRSRTASSRGSAQVDSVKTPIPQLKEHLLSPEFFNADETPTIEFPPTTSGSPRTAAPRSTAS